MTLITFPISIFRLGVSCVELGCLLDRRWDVVSWRRFKVLVRYFLLDGLNENVVFAAVGCRSPGVLNVFDDQDLTSRGILTFEHASRP